MTQPTKTVLIAINIAITIALAYFGSMQIQQGNPLGWILLLCIVVHWSLFARRRKTS